MKPRDMRRLPGVVALAAGVTLAAACSGGPSSSTAGNAPAPAAPSGQTSAAPSPTAAAKLSVAQLKQRAAADAASIMAQFPPPPGAKKIAKPPAPAAALLAHPAFSTGSFDSVDTVTWWLAPGTPQALLAWEEGNMPSQFQINTLAPVSIGPVASDTYFLSPQAGVLAARDLVVALASAGAGRTAIRVDAQVAWQPPRPAAEVLPATAKAVTIAETCPPRASCKPPLKKITITSASLIDHIAGVLNELSVFAPGVYQCPAPTAHALMLTFTAAQGGKPVAVAVNTGQCGSVTVTMNGKPQPSLADPGPFTPAGDYATQVLNAALLNWKL